ncbi:NAD(P)/FAD-dependent oxidoreductase [Mycobacterium sp. 852002-40037_SCH5390672]|uniref:flavin-containing monooxygenase n=1 Tax=Mycobacterium sp. 852002-40037_SCH5390672 TaxID=1834089 RepID=UPI0008055989|nr:NAD(P)/FAD-dependent oxidoreductase [Mycobacterium sp. 852002-40037_SCH5390672]OBB96773.1 hypothetical protein A5782_03285 [Mycobacterium sp. 852002-40037_SCH5390672]
MPDIQAIIVGAGFSGLGAAIQLSKIGIDDFIILERFDGVGGAWYANRYPGIAVDTTAPTYSYSFAPNPDWSRLYAPGAEIQQYADRITRDYQLRNRIRFNITVSAARWDEKQQLWRVSTHAGVSMTCRILIIATGLLSQVKEPDIAGLSSFQGKVLHTAAWDGEYDPTGAQIALIGTGATAVQLLPEIAAKAARVDVYQRRPIWVAPKIDFPFPRFIRALFRAFPLTQKVIRHLSAAVNEVLALAFLVHRYFPVGIQACQALCKVHLWLQVRSPEVRAKLTPDYTFWCKRPTFSNAYLRAFNRSHVKLITTPIESVVAEGVVTSDGVTRPIDTLILATGFALQERGNFPPFPVVGAHHIEMGEAFHQHGYDSYEGITVAGFPNLFYLSGPFSFAGLSYFFAVESQMTHIRRVLLEMRRCDAATFEVKAAAQQRFVTEMEKLLGASVWRDGRCQTANSYYFNEHGLPRLVRVRPTVQARWRDRRFPMADYEFGPRAASFVARSATE